MSPRRSHTAVLADYEGKTFNDAVHGHFTLPWLCVKIVDTPHFQRLRDLKQLGGTYYVFPCASHNRFEHSLGTAHLAGDFVRTLRDRQPELAITAADVLAIQVAGLCHDLGHGPFSHMFDNNFIPKAIKAIKERDPEAVTAEAVEHETISVRMIDALVEENGLWKEFKEAGLKEIDMTFIKECIEGIDPREAKGRGPEKAFLYEIISNKRNGIDVDKFDYFMRDSKALNISATFDPYRLKLFMKAMKGNDGQMQLCFKASEAWNLYELYHTRYTLHKRAYQHKVSNIYEDMVCEAMLLAEPYLRIPGKDGKPCSLVESIEDMEAYSKVTDCILNVIQCDTRPEMLPAQNVLKDLRSRRMHKHVGEMLLSGESSQSVAISELIASAPKQIFALVPDEAKQSSDGNSENDLLKLEEIQIGTIGINYGKKDKNPIDQVSFYLTSADTVATKMETQHVSLLIPKVFSEKYLRVTCRNRSKAKLVNEAYLAWWKTIPRDLAPRALVTPAKPEAESNRTEGAPVTKRPKLE